MFNFFKRCNKSKRSENKALHPTVDEALHDVDNALRNMSTVDDIDSLSVFANETYSDAAVTSQTKPVKLTRITEALLAKNLSELTEGQTDFVTFNPSWNKGSKPWTVAELITLLWQDYGLIMIYIPEPQDGDVTWDVIDVSDAK